MKATRKQARCEGRMRPFRAVRIHVLALVLALGMASLTVGCRKDASEAGATLPVEGIMVAAAVSTSGPLEAIAKASETGGGPLVTFSWGASNVLARQLGAGAKVDVFVSADRASADAVVAAGRAKASEVRPLVRNRLVLVVPGGSTEPRIPSDAADVDARLSKLVAQAGRLALSDPEGVPQGRYSKAWLERRGWWTAVEKNVVPVADARSVLSVVAKNAAPLGIVYRTEALRAGDSVRVVYEVPESETPGIDYWLVTLVDATPAAKAWAARLLEDASMRQFERSGFSRGGDAEQGAPEQRK